jgi:hypothetical protein
MRCSPWRNSHARLARIARAAALSVACVALVPAIADAATFYKWIDKDGVVHYGDAPPKGFGGEVTRIDVDPGAHTVPAPPPPPTGVAPESREAPKPAPDLLDRRRATRDRLEANLAQARARLDVARKALAEVGEPQADEWQTTVGGPPGPGPQVARSNCHKAADGRVICPGRVPSEAYYTRVQQLEDAVKRAVADVEDAERAYRRGVD